MSFHTSSMVLVALMDWWKEVENGEGDEVEDVDESDFADDDDDDDEPLLLRFRVWLKVVSLGPPIDDSIWCYS